MALIAVGNVTLNTANAKGCQIVNCIDPNDRGKSMIEFLHPMDDRDIVVAFKGPDEQAKNVMEVIRHNWFFDTLIYLDKPRILTEEEIGIAFGRIDGSDKLIFRGVNQGVSEIYETYRCPSYVILVGISAGRTANVQFTVSLDFEKDNPFPEQLGLYIQNKNTVKEIIKRIKGERSTFVTA